MSAHYVPELGQAIFGAPGGKYECPRYVTSLIQCLLGEIRRVQPEWNENEDLNFARIEYHPYCWGDCTCGYADEEEEWDRNHQHTADCFHTRYLAEEERQRGKARGNLKEWRKVDDYMTQWAKDNGYKDAPYGMAVYCTCPYGQEWREWASTHWHAPDCKLMQPNFKFGEVEIRWYKHVGRGMSANVDWDEMRWRKWFADCFIAINAAKEKGQ